jgi:hypothetical protein
VPASELTFLERKILTQWAEEAYVSFDLLERCAKKFESDWGLAWPLLREFDAQDVVVAAIASHRFNGLNVLSVWHGGMCSGGFDFYLADVDFLDRQILYYYDSGLERGCVSPLSVFTTDAIGLEIRRSPKPKRPKAKPGLPELDHSRSAVLDSLRSPESKRGYRHAIDEFVQWYCSEPRLSFNKTVVTRYRIHLENRQLAAGTINGRLAAVRRLADEAADAGLLSPELAAGIRRVKGVKKLGVRLGNWLSSEEARRL